MTPTTTNCSSFLRVAGKSESIWDRFCSVVGNIADGDMALIAQPIDVLGVNFHTRQIVAADPDVEAALVHERNVGS